MPMHLKKWVWSDKFIIENETVDFQHQALFRVINDLIHAYNLSDGSSNIIVEVAIIELIKYSNFHFGDEESLMEKINYPGIKTHKQEHQDFRDVIMHFKYQLDEGKEIERDLIEFMETWLVKHILIEDKKALLHSI
jgi:hemerythrin